MSFQIKFSKPLAIAAIASNLLASNAAAVGNDEFEDDPSVAQTTIDWPEVDFPDNSNSANGFRPGQMLEYRAQWGFFRKAGKIRIETHLPTSGDQDTVEVKTTTASAGLIRSLYPMTLEAVATIDTDTWQMQSNEVDGKTRSDINRTLTLIDYETEQLTFEDFNEPARNQTRNLPYLHPFDYSSTLLQLRSYDLQVGETYPIFVTSKGKFYLIEMKVAAVEDQKTKFGQFECFRLEPVKATPQSKLFREGGKMAIWITNNAERLPVRFDVSTSIGTATIRLEDYESPKAGSFAARASN